MAYDVVPDWEECTAARHCTIGSWLFHEWPWGVCFTHIEATDEGRQSIQSECHNPGVNVKADEAGHPCTVWGRADFCSHQATMELALRVIEAFEIRLWRKLLHHEI